MSPEYIILLSLALFLLLVGVGLFGLIVFYRSFQREIQKKRDAEDA